MPESGLHFAQPLWLWGLLAIPLVIAWLMYSSPLRQRGQEVKYADAHLLAFLSGVATTRVVSSRRPLLGWALAWGLLSLAKQQQTLAGRKTLLYFSEGLEVPPQIEGAYRATISAANVAITNAPTAA